MEGSKFRALPSVCDPDVKGLGEHDQRLAGIVGLLQREFAPQPAIGETEKISAVPRDPFRNERLQSSGTWAKPRYESTSTMG
jgi:hypothetical protein